MPHQAIHHHSLFRRAALALGLLLSLLLLQPDGPAQAGNFDLSGACGDVAALRQAITNANAAGGANTIILAENCEYQFNDAHNYADGPNVLPSITGNITIEGNGSMLAASRSGRHFHIAGSGNLTLKNLELHGGAGGGGLTSGAGFGGSVYNRGTLQAIGTTFHWNIVAGGGGSYNNGLLGGGGGVFGRGVPNSPWGGLVGGAGGGGGGSAGSAQWFTETVTGQPGDTNYIGGSNGGLPALDRPPCLLPCKAEDSSLACINPQTSVNECRGGLDGQNLTGGGGGGRGGEGTWSGGDGGDGSDGGNGGPGGGGGAGGAGGQGGSHVISPDPFIAFAGDGGNGGDGGDGGFGGGGGSGGDGNRAGCFVDTKGTSDPTDDQLVCGLDGRGGDGGNGGFGGGGGAGGFGYNANHGTGGQGGFGGGDGGGPVASTYPGPYGAGGGAGMGGAIFNHAGTLLVTNSTFGNNQINAGGGANGGSALGGAIFNYQGQVTLTNSTLAFNKVFTGTVNVGSDGTPGVSGEGTGGAIYNYQGSLTLKNSILARSETYPSNNPGNALDCVNNGGTVIAPASSKNLIEKSSGCGTPALTGDPNFAYSSQLTDNGGPTPTFALVANSPARNAGNNAICAAAPANNLDQRGYFRVDTTCDIGAFEFDGDVDTDGDGLFDSWETNGIDFNKDGTIDLELYDINGDGLIQATEQADPNHKDIYLELDWMAQHQPALAGLNAVITSFANAPVSNPDGTSGIRLHLLSDAEAVAHNDLLTFVPCTGSAPSGSGVPDFDEVKAANFGTAAERGNGNGANILAAKRLVFRYTLYAHNLFGEGDTSGCAELPGNDFVVSLGWYYQGTHAPGNSDQQAGTLMHELGHTLNLRHGGSDGINCKPNYLSIMSYTRQFDHNIPNRPLDYSRSLLPALTESSLNETLGIGGSAGDRTAFGPSPLQTNVTASGSIDWDGDGELSGSVSRDLNNFGFEGCPGDGSVLSGYDDWDNLLYDFRNASDFADGVHLTVLANEEVDLEELEPISLDSDGDGLVNIRDNCPYKVNPNQEDSDGDGDGEACTTTTSKGVYLPLLVK